MSNVVQFLEALASNPKPMSAEEFSSAVADLDPMVQPALIAGDVSALNKALGGRARMICMVAPAENDEPVDDDQNEQEESPEQEVSSQAA